MSSIQIKNIKQDKTKTTAAEQEKNSDYEEHRQIETATSAGAGPSSNFGPFSVNSPIERVKITTGPEDPKINPFTTRSSLRRTPPRERSNSIARIDTDPPHQGEVEQQNKRKRLEQSNEKEDDSEFQTAEATKTLKKILRTIKKLETVMRDVYNPKRELKETATKLSWYAEELESQKLLEQLEKIEDNEKRLRYENQMLCQQIQETVLPIASTKLPNVSMVMCDECKKEQIRTVQRETFKKEETFENFQLITEDDWQQELFTRASEETGPIWEAPIGHDMLLPCSRTLDSRNKTIRAAINNFGGKHELSKQIKTKGDVAMMTHTLGFPDDTGNMKHKTRNLYYPIITDGVPLEEPDDRIVFESLKKVKNHMVKEGRTELAIPEQEGVGGMMLERMVEYLFENTSISPTIFRATKEYGRQKPRQHIRDGNMRSISTDDNVTMRRKVPKQDAILVQMKDKSYADLLKIVKKNVNPSEIGAHVDRVTKTRSGKLLLTVQNGADKAEALRRELKEKIPDAQASFLISKKVLHVSGLDEVTNEEEIKSEISKILNTKPENIDTRSLRPAYGGTQKVTLILPVTEAEKLIQTKKIKIGWSSCKVVERKRDPKCFKCWEYGHVKSECNGPNREHLCLKCGKEGHIAKTCKNAPYCIHCKKEGHQSGNPKCRTNLKAERSNLEEQSSNADQTQNSSN